MTAKRDVEAWEESVGYVPHKVTVYEEVARKGVLYLRWRANGNWRKKSLGRPLRTARGAIDAEVKKWAVDQAKAKYATLAAGIVDTDRAPVAPLTIAGGLAAVIDPQTGKYPTDTAHRREVVREMTRAIAAWGANAAWADIKKRELRKLWRARILELRSAKATGLRGAEITVARVIAVASWLRDEEMIPIGACVPAKKWKTEMRADWMELSGELALPDPERPRHTLDEMRRIIAAASKIDPRLELALALGAELRIGQVIRCRRSDLHLGAGTLTVRGKGHKRGVVMNLTAGQLLVAKHHLSNGYLRYLERAAADYPLFPAGQFPGGRKMSDPVATVARHLNAPHIARSVLDGWFHDAEDAATPPVPSVKGRAAYGLRRAAVDAAKAAGISREGLKEHGGWTDTQMPDRVYADQQAEYARDEARDVRAKIRGEDESG